MYNYIRACVNTVCADTQRNYYLEYTVSCTHWKRSNPASLVPTPKYKNYSTTDLILVETAYCFFFLERPTLDIVQLVWQLIGLATQGGQWYESFIYMYIRNYVYNKIFLKHTIKALSIQNCV